MKVINPIEGKVMLDEQHLDIGYYEQENYYTENVVIDEISNEFPKNTKTEVRRMLARCGLTDEHINSKLCKLSGGEQAKVRLCKVINNPSNILFLDEPTNHLDIKYQLSLLNIVKDLDLTIVAAIHDLNIAAMYCDRLFVMKNGKIVGSGTPQEVLTKEFIKEIYDIDVEIVNDSKGDMHILYSR